MLSEPFIMLRYSWVRLYAMNMAGARWEMQLKGAWLTPFSRTADSPF